MSWWAQRSPSARTSCTCRRSTSSPKEPDRPSFEPARTVNLCRLSRWAGLLRIPEDEEIYERSAIAEHPVDRRVFLCEGYLAEAPRYGLEGDKAAMHAALERCVGTGQDTYEACTLAEILLKRGLCPGQARKQGFRDGKRG